ncbi:MAG: twin-arginine translocation signal domain-containing protein [Acidimicrobiales bacterium]
MHSPVPYEHHPVSRRRFLAMSAAAGGAAVLAACGGGGSGSGTTDEQLAVVQRFSNAGLVPGDVRLPISLANQQGILDNDGTARFGMLTASVKDLVSGKTVIESVTAEKHGTGFEYPYWPFVVRIDTPGTYSLVVKGGSSDGGAFQVLEASSVQMPYVGAKLPPFDTPTVKDARGVDPVCTLTPEPCPFHSVTLTDALAAGKPVAYLVGTPAHCKTGTCAPALTGLMEESSSFGNIAFVHAEVYRDRSGTLLAPAVEAYKLQFEPILFVADASGTVTHRLDGVFDAAEIRSVLSSL